ncbi:MAG: type III pantothenate kinase [Pseudohongiellaceae bacterium]
MILELDAGNTRIKWRLIEESAGKVNRVAENSVYALEKVPSVFIELGKQLDKLPLAEINRMRVANVRGNSFREAFSALMTEKWHLQPEYARVEQACAGVSNSYTDYQTMGVDRWLAMLAAYRDAGGSCCIVDCGSTVTIDIIDDSGRHQGGYIVPGLQLMREALAGRSRALKINAAAHWDSIQPGNSTQQAIENGILNMVLGMIEKVRAELRGNPQWYLTGGDARILLPFLDWQYELVPDLVMDGLALAMD